MNKTARSGIIIYDDYTLPVRRYEKTDLIHDIAAYAFRGRIRYKNRDSSL